jgi:hypothetical protein
MKKVDQPKMIDADMGRPPFAIACGYVLFDSRRAYTYCGRIRAIKYKKVKGRTTGSSGACSLVAYRLFAINSEVL